MKVKNILPAFFMLFAAAGFTLDIEKALAEAAASISKDLKQGSTIAIVGISSDSEKMSNFMLDELAFQFLKLRKLTVADRKSLDAIKKEMKFQLSGEVSDETIQKIGAMTGAKTVLSGVFENMGGYYMLTLKALDVSSGTLQSGYRQKVNANETTEMLLANTARITTKRKGGTGFGSYSSAERFKIGMANYFAFGLGSYLAGYTGDGIGLTVTHIVGLSLFWGGIGGMIKASERVYNGRDDNGRGREVIAISLGAITEFIAFLYGCIIPVTYDKKFSKVASVVNKFNFDLVADSRGNICPRLAYKFPY